MSPLTPRNPLDVCLELDPLNITLDPWKPLQPLLPLISPLSLMLSLSFIGISHSRKTLGKNFLCKKMTVLKCTLILSTWQAILQLCWNSPWGENLFMWKNRCPWAPGRQSWSEAQPWTPSPHSSPGTQSRLQQEEFPYEPWENNLTNSSPDLQCTEYTVWQEIIGCCSPVSIYSEVGQTRSWQP